LLKVTLVVPILHRPTVSASVNGRTGVLYTRKFDQNAQN